MFLVEIIYIYTRIIQWFNWYKFSFSLYSDDLEEAHDYELLKKDEPAPTSSPSAEAENEKAASGKIQIPSQRNIANHTSA